MKNTSKTGNLGVHSRTRSPMHEFCEFNANYTQRLWSSLASFVYLSNIFLKSLDMVLGYFNVCFYGISWVWTLLSIRCSCVEHCWVLSVHVLEWECAVIDPSIESRAMWEPVAKLSLIRLELPRCHFSIRVGKTWDCVHSFFQPLPKQKFCDHCYKPNIPQKWWNCLWFVAFSTFG